MTMEFKDKTRGGLATGLYRADADGPYPNHGWIMEHDGVSRSHDWTADGRWAAAAGASPYDLLPLREPSEAAVEAAQAASATAAGVLVNSERVRTILRIAYEIDGIGGGE